MPPNTEITTRNSVIEETVNVRLANSLTAPRTTNLPPFPPPSARRDVKRGAPPVGGARYASGPVRPA
jgi:hypothetical protein